MKTSLWRILIAGTAAVIAVNGQIANKPIPRAADYYEIMELNARFCHALDSGEDQGRTFASTFVPDGSYVDGEGKEAKGAAALAALARNAGGEGVNPRHFVINIRIETTPGGARQWSYLQVTGALEPGKPDVVVSGGQYWDDLVQTPSGWRFKKRTLLNPGTVRPEHDTFFSAAAAAPPAVARAAVSMADKSGLTAADRAEIYQLYAHYPYTLDKLIDYGRAYANLFAPDGVLMNPDGTSIIGRDKISEYIWRNGPSERKTYITNVVLDPTANGINAKSYMMTAVIAQLPDVATISPSGIAYDQLVKTPEGWKFSRKMLVAMHAPVPVFPAIPASARKPASETASANSPWRLTAEDYAEIQQLYPRYAQGFDSKAESGAMYLSVFSKTARFTDQWNKFVEGFENLDRLNAHSPSGKPNPISFGHSTWNLMVDPAPWGAVGHSDTGGGRANQPGSPLSAGLLGEYLDTIVKTEVGWRYDRRFFRQEFQKPVGRGGPPPSGQGNPSRSGR